MWCETSIVFGDRALRFRPFISSPLTHRISVSPSDEWGQTSFQKDSHVPSTQRTKKNLKAWSSIPRTARQAGACVRFFRFGRVETFRNYRLAHLRGRAGRVWAPNQELSCLLLLPTNVLSVELQYALCKGSQRSRFSCTASQCLSVDKKSLFFQSLCGSSNNRWVGPGVQTLTCAHFFSFSFVS